MPVDPLPLARMTNPDTQDRERRRNHALRALIEKHVKATGSKHAENILAAWPTKLPKFLRVIPKDYKRVLEAFKRVTAAGLSGEEAIMAAFEENAKDAARVGGG